MFTVCSIFLLVVSCLVLLTSVHDLIRPRAFVELSGKELVAGAVYTLLVVVAVIYVTAESSSRFRYYILIFMMCSLIFDLIYMINDQALKSQRSLPRRWWAVLDNLAWIAAVIVLYRA